jgi:heat shock protein HslJ
LLVIAAGLAACASTNHENEAVPGTSWNLASLRETGTFMTPVVPGSTPTLSFSRNGSAAGSNGSVAGSTGCNTFTGSYLLSASRLTITPQHANGGQCPSVDLMRQQAAIKQELPQVRNYRISNNVLSLMNTAGDTVLTYNRK